MSGETGGLTAEEREALAEAIYGPRSALKFGAKSARIEALIERIVAARVGDQAAALARVEALHETEDAK